MPSTPIKKEPQVRIPVAFSQHGLSNFGTPYKPMPKPDSPQEDWYTIAEKHNTPVSWLISFNFLTVDPDEVNWCLERYVGCTKVSPSGNNFMFDQLDKPGIIFIPPADERSFHYDEFEVCTWIPESARKFLLLLEQIVNNVPGELGRRLKKLVKIMRSAKYPGMSDLWFYNPLVVEIYLDPDLRHHTGEAKRRDMTKHKPGFFEGKSGVYSQHGSFGEPTGEWQLFPIKDILSRYTCGHRWDSAMLQHELELIVSGVTRGWGHVKRFKNVNQHGSIAGKNAHELADRIISLSKSPTSLYSILF